DLLDSEEDNIHTAARRSSRRGGQTGLHYTPSCKYQDEYIQGKYGITPNSRDALSSTWKMKFVDCWKTYRDKYFSRYSRQYSSSTKDCCFLLLRRQKASNFEVRFQLKKLCKQVRITFSDIPGGSLRGRTTLSQHRDYRDASVPSCLVESKRERLSGMCCYGEGYTCDSGFSCGTRKGP
ncbi:MAG: hypothetical protein ACE3JU_11565, partial [Paenibacillus sp.]|uniref:hypothetical protein n=1 Tax=Paenibacillus sp. TaxID=58172 RepID=UPI003B817221